MDAIRKQASKLREQVARQQQQQKLEKLHISTRSAKHFQRDIVRGVEGFIVTGSKQVEIGTKLSEDSRKYGSENSCTSGSALSKAALSYSSARMDIERERENLLKTLGTQVAEPLRAMVVGAPLEDARRHAQRYDRVRQESETQVIEVARRQAKVKESNGNPENLSKFEAAQVRLKELKSNMTILGKEAVATMSAVEAQQQRLTLQRLITMVEAEKNHYQKLVHILDRLEGEMMQERQRIEAPPLVAAVSPMSSSPPEDDNNGVQASQSNDIFEENMDYYLAEVIHPYEAESDAELSLTVGEYVVVRKVSTNGWAEGECEGKAGWFPLEYVERRDRILDNKVAEV
ncbi:SH3 domain-containing protein 2-like isoform X2 [Rutidosis leptorrhynchoides]|uniref:SH3 domain-containing protein 2-like isoform X2 n=1 Tax=Rutidosis leptorrhynchoides TaxID=125765 RepID=UPI003A991EB9